MERSSVAAAWSSVESSAPAPLGPVMLAGALPAQPAGADHGLSGDDGRVPIGSGGER